MKKSSKGTKAPAAKPSPAKDAPAAGPVETSVEPATTPASAPPETPAPNASSQPAGKAPAKPARTTPPKSAGEKKAAPARAPAPPKPAAPPEFPSSATVVDASGLVVGRAASLIAKRLLNGETIVVVNAEKSVVTGNRSMVIREFTAARAQGSVRSGPHYPRFPDRIFRRTVRGMLPHLKTRGKVAFSRLHVFIGVPSALSGRPTVSLEGAKARPALRPPTPLREISTLLGAHL